MSAPGAMPESAVLGAVLAGGRSSRFGSDKALHPVEGRVMAVRVAAALSGGGAGTVVAVGGNAAALAEVGLAVVPDRWPGDGPVGALVTVFEFARERRPAPAVVIVAPCDLAWLDGATIGAVLGPVIAEAPAVDVAVAFDAATGRRQPLLSAWSVDATAGVARSAFLDGARAAHGLLDALAHAGLAIVEVTVDGERLRNVNHPGDLDR